MLVLSSPRQSSNSNICCWFTTNSFLLYISSIVALLIFSTSSIPAARAETTTATTQDNLIQVACPSTRKTFVGLTELRFEGRTKWFRGEERMRLKHEFEHIYNSLTEASCDTYFRRLVNLTFVSMTNSLQATFDIAAENGNGNSGRTRGRYLQQDGTNVNSTDSTPTPSINILYNVTGTCRDCPSTRDGSFKIYDDAFRRKLGDFGTAGTGNVQIHTRLLSITTTIMKQTRRRILGEGTTTTTTTATDDANADCFCVEGTQPLQPRAPGVQECVDAMNERFDSIRQEEPEAGLFNNVVMTNLTQRRVDVGEEEDINNGSINGNANSAGQTSAGATNVVNITNTTM